MVRTVKSHHHNYHQNQHQHLPEEEEDEAEDVAAGTGTDTSSHREGKSAEQKPSNSRSKHSETEQRRRSKINERFQILRDLIPPNDQKRDKASLLLEVIEYIQFLQEKLQVYEGSYEQVWGQEPTKLIPWRANHLPVDNFANNPQAMKNGSLEENIAAQPLTNMQSSVESEYSGEFAYRGSDHPAGTATQAAPLNMPLQTFPYPPLRNIPAAENHASQPPGSSISECAIVGNEVRTFETGSSSVSNDYSQGLLKKLTQALQTSGVDLSQANISVQLDVSKRANIGSNATTSSAEDVSKQPARDHPGSQFGEVSGKDSIPASKRPRTGES